MVKIPIKTAKEKEQEAEVSAEVSEKEHDVVADETAPLEAQKPESVASEQEASQEAPEAPVTEPVVDVVADTETAEATAAEATAADNKETLPAEEAEVDEAPLKEEADLEEEELDELTLLTRQVQAKDQEITEHYEARLRLQAEFDNFKKRKEKELADFRKYANESLLQDILSVVDDFERAIAAAEQTHKLEDFLQGVELIFSKFLDVLQKKGVKEIEAESGQVFNPNMHEAVTQIETNEIEEGAIAAVFQKGYYLHDRVIRAPKVGVAKPKG
jgi:molecular chaperone GrpE